MTRTAADLTRSSRCMLVRSSLCFPPLSLQSSLLTVEYTTAAKPKVAKESLKFGATTSDHMLEIDWDAVKGWHAPRIIPYQPLKLDPAASVLHYGLEVREREAGTQWQKTRCSAAKCLTAAHLCCSALSLSFSLCSLPVLSPPSSASRV